MRLHISRQPNLKSATLAAEYYSRSQDFWGVELQRAGIFDRAATNFENALLLNPNNVVAQINLAFNKQHLAGTPVTMDLSQATIDRFGKYATWNEVLDANGPFDEPNFCFVFGTALFADNQYYRQSVSQFERVRELAPDYLPARLMLAQAYLINRLPQRAAAALREPLQDPAKFSLNETNETQINILAAVIDFEENNPTHGTKLINTEITRHPDDNNLLATAAQIFIARGLFTNALTVINQRLKSDPDNPVWLYNRGYVAIQMKDYAAAISALNRVLEIQTNNGNALFNRAIANLDSGRLDAAQTDYLRLQQAVSNAPPIVYGLGEIARLKNETNEAIN